MQSKVKIVGLDCPNCARSLQNEINKLEGITNADIEFVNSSLTFESENPEEALMSIISLTKKLEPHARIYTEGKDNKNRKGLIIDVMTLTIGIILGIILLTCSMSKWLFWSLYVTSALLLGWKTYLKAANLLFKGIINENLLITISVVGASVISEHMEGLMVIALYSIGKIFEGLAVNKSRNSIEKLVRLQPEFANIIIDGKEKRVKPEEVKLGSTIVVHAGEKIPLDGIVLKGQVLVDNQSLTGESVPVQRKEGDEILSGGIVLDGTIEIKTTSEQKDSTVAKIMNLVENASKNKSKTETFISKITRWYTLGVVVIALLVLGIVWIVTKNFELALYRGLIFLVVSCPCAFAISVPLSYFSGLGNASKNGMLIKGSNFLDACAGLEKVAFDKTGTLTTGKFEIKEVESYNGLSKEEIIYLCALGEQNSLHPLAKAVCAACKGDLEKVENIHEVAGEGLNFTYQDKEYFVGRKDKNLKTTTIELYENNVKIGQIELRDMIKTSSRLACEGLNGIGIKTVLLSGDNQESVDKVAKEIGINEAKSQLLPQEKYEYIKTCQENGEKIGYVGDGINDAPSLTLANVGFSMGINGSPASIEASDVVIVDDNPQKILSAIKISRYTRKIVWENIILSALVKVVVLSLGAAGITGMLVAVFADVGVTLLAVLNSMRALKYNPNRREKMQKRV